MVVIHPLNPLERDRLIDENLDLERRILADIEQRTGICYRRLGGLRADTGTAEIPAEVLPILLEWLPAARLTWGMHGVIYHCFATPHAQPYLELMLTWWREEVEAGAESITLQALAGSLRNHTTHATAERIWRVLQRHPCRSDDLFALIRLAACPATKDEVCQELLTRLNTPGKDYAAEVKFIAAVNDVRIRAWYLAHVASPDPKVRAIAKRVAARQRRLPAGIDYAHTAPDRVQERFSTEVDVAEVPALLRELAARENLTLPAALRRLTFLQGADLDRWLVATLPEAQFHLGQLWFRLEDVDTVEVVLIEQNPSEC